ncbi:hypothetical protein FE410_05235 [Leuconostoc carnosum]|uniref:pyocin knob domain-containing protein n=1 Tax=Leuconostoc carnosum TaxID=1252 RepID=UPI00123A7989|nr:pyocin knob domain-containing protein [Leuconostoc carnosum]KAA8371094.1 hypothetical protein FE414_05230 [Leuconostoc carnosum]KAA8382735.1 hypothetical protein FE410_05235 [Leuconostoc carnosum]
MEQFQQPVLSNKFLNILASTSTSTDSIVFKRAIASSDKHIIGDLKAFDDTYIQTLKKSAESTFSDVQQVDNNIILVSVFSSNGNVKDYEINTVIYTAMYKGQEFLAFSQITNWPIRVPAGNDSEVYNLTLKPKVVLSSTNAISTTISPEALATNERVDAKERNLQKQLDDASKDRKSIWNNFTSFISKKGAQTVDSALTFTQKLNGRITLADRADSAASADKLKDGDQTINGNVSVPKDNTMVNVGNDNDIALVKKNGQGGTLVIGNGKVFRLQKSNNANILPTDSFTDLMTLDQNGNLKANSFIGVSSSALEMRMQILSETDMNNYIDSGLYRLYGVYVKNYRHSNIVYGILFVNFYGNNRQQLFFDNSDNTINIRWYTNNKWTNWDSLARSSQPTTWIGSQTFSGGIEISHATPFIDFHYGKNTKDFTSRIIEDREGRLNFLDGSSKKQTLGANIDGNAETSNIARSPQVIGLSPNTDLNTIKTPGSYSLQGGRPINSPVSNWFSLTVTSIGSYNGTQILQNSNTGEIWTRGWNEANKFTIWTLLNQQESKMFPADLNGSADQSHNISVSVLNNIAYISGYFHVTIQRGFGDVVGNLSVTPNKSIFTPVFINGEKYGSGEMVLRTNGDFSFDAIKLNDGKNVVPAESYVYLSPFSFPLV